MAKKKYIRQQGFMPWTTPDGRVGFRFQLDMFCESGTALAGVLPIKVALDGNFASEEKIWVSIDGRWYNNLEEEETKHVYWRYGSPMDVFVETGSQVSEGLHEITLFYYIFSQEFIEKRQLTALGSDDPTCKIKRGVSFYSYRVAAANREMSFEDRIAETMKMGATGVEIVPMEDVPNYPYPDSDFYRQWFKWRELYGFTPVSYSSSKTIVKNHFAPQNVDETFEELRRDIIMAKDLGFKMIRAGVVTPIPVLERLIPVAEKYRINVAIEVHPPFSMNSPWMDSRLEFFEKANSEMFGLIPDMGIFAKRTAPMKIKQLMKRGANPDIVAKLETAYSTGMKKEDAEAYAGSLGAKDVDMQAVRMIFGNNYDDPELLVQYIKYIKNVHGKFYEMDASMQETSIDYEGALSALLRAGYDGFICSEYEGEDFYDNFDDIEEVEQLRRQHLLVQRLLKR